MHPRSIARVFAALSLVLPAALVLVACSGDDASPGTTASTAPRVGGSCSAAQACGPSERCLVNEPGGLCVLPCTKSGEAEGCPSNALCDEDSFAGDAGPEDLTVCLQRCEKDEECRAGYACSGVSNATGKVCKKQGS